MSTVYSVRIPKKLREVLDDLDEVDWQQEVRTFLENKARRELTAKKLDEGRRLRSAMKAKVSAADIIREDRENAH